jgi:hypothetical protein
VSCERYAVRESGERCAVRWGFPCRSSFVAQRPPLASIQGSLEPRAILWR